MLQGVVDQANAFVRGTTPEEEMRKRLGAERNDRRYSVLDQDHTKSDAFKEWFGDWENDPEHASKVVDENGRPLVVYHGSPIAGFTEFYTDDGPVWVTSAESHAKDIWHVQRISRRTLYRQHISIVCEHQESYSGRLY